MDRGQQQSSIAGTRRGDWAHSGSLTDGQPRPRDVVQLADSLHKHRWSTLHISVGVLLVGVLAGCTSSSGGSGDGLVECGSGSPGGAEIEVDTPVGLADQPVSIRVSGLDPDEPVTVRARANDWQGEGWEAQASFAADADGVVDLDRDAPTSGTYQPVDGMGLFWSMNPPAGDSDQAWFWPVWPEVAPSFEVHLAVCTDEGDVASATLTREWMSEGVDHRAVSLEESGVLGDMYLPSADAEPRQGVLLIGGSEGGVSHKYEAALLASHGHPTLALAYFGEPGLPDELRSIPLEYFADAAQLLAAESEVGQSVAVLGYSRGGEPALLMAQHFPELVRGVVVYAGHNQVVDGFPSGGVAWTLEGEPLRPRQDIPLDSVAGPVLAIAGDDDVSFWRADAYAELILKECESAQSAHSCEALIYPGAGHFVGTFPFQATGTTLVHPVTGETIDWGGTRETNEEARRDGWPRVLDFLATLS